MSIKDPSLFKEGSVIFVLENEDTADEKNQLMVNSGAAQNWNEAAQTLEVNISDEKEINNIVNSLTFSSNSQSSKMVSVYYKKNEEVIMLKEELLKPQNESALNSSSHTEINVTGDIFSTINNINLNYEHFNEVSFNSVEEINNDNNLLNVVSEDIINLKLDTDVVLDARDFIKNVESSEDLSGILNKLDEGHLQVFVHSSESSNVSLEIISSDLTCSIELNEGGVNAIDYGSFDIINDFVNNKS